MSSLVPLEIITDILCRLPVKSLLRFRCVSKPWCSQIDCSDFIKLHYNHSLKTNANLSLIFSDMVDLFSLDFDTLDTAVKLNNPIESGGAAAGVTRVMGSCNGLVALFNYHQDMALWNPSTTRYHKIPPTALPIDILEGCYEVIGYGFGYDPVSDDYKLVRMVEYPCEDQDLSKSHVEVYSLKSNSWRQTRDFPYCECCYPLGMGTLANNTLHWNVVKKSERDPVNLIVGFDLRVEEYFEVPLPHYMDNNCSMCVESLGGCLCLVCDYENVGVGVDIWVMKEYGVKESWIKLFTTANSDVTVNPLAYSKSGDRVLMDQCDDGDGKFVWYDLRGGRAEDIRIQGPPKSFDVKMCVASLVPLSGVMPCHEATSTSEKEEKE